MRSVAAIAMITLVLVLAGGGHVLVRIDRANAWAQVARSEAKLARAELRLEAARHIVHRDATPQNDPRLEILVRRTDALRGAIFALVRTGKVSMPGNPGGDWIVWPLELAEVR